MAMHSIVDYTQKLADTFAKQGIIATVESTTTASKAYDADDYLMYDETLYKVTTAIAIGGTIVTTGAGANVEATDVTTEIGAVSTVPAGGTTNQSLMKNSGTDGDVKWGDALGKKITSTVSGDSVSFVDSSISATSVIDGPYIADVLMGIDDVEVSGTTITYTFDSSDANGKTAYIWIR